MANGNQIIIYANRRLGRLPIKGEDKRAFFSEKEEKLDMTYYTNWLIDELKNRHIDIGNITRFLITQHLEIKGDYSKYLNIGLDNPLKYESTDENNGIWLSEEKIVNSNKNNNRKNIIDSIIAGCKLYDRINGSENGGLMVITGIRRKGIKNYIEEKKYHSEIRKSIGNVGRIRLI